MLADRCVDADTGLIFDIQGHSVHDGPGTRTTVFLNGCPLRCIWCSNPEGLFTHPVMMYRQGKCKGCGDCLAACPSGAARVVGDQLVHDREACDACQTHECVDACLNEAMVKSGKYYTTEEVLRILQRDRQFWGKNGGVSFSGGEPLMQRPFINNLMRRCKEVGIHVCVETSSCLPTAHYLDALRFADWVFTDIKHMDPVTHMKLTGRGNALILHNIETLARSDWEGVIMPRIPVVPGCNDSEANLMATVDFIRNIGLDVVNLLPFHRLGESKHRQLGRTFDMADQPSPADATMQRLKELVQSRGVLCFVGWETPF